MAKVNVWPAVHTERKALAADLDGIDEAAWDTRTLCDEWSVRDVVAHMTATAKMSGGKFFGKMIGSGFSLTRLQTKDIAVERGSSAADTLGRFKAQVDSTGGPPGPDLTVLGETVLHGEDIRRPLGIKRDYPMATLTEVADFYKGSNLIIGTKKRIAGLGLKATDTDWSHGAGAAVEGPMLSLVLAMTGRPIGLDELTGDGVDTLRARP